MKSNNFEKKLKDDLHQYVSTVDVKKLWADIAPEVDFVNENKTKQKRRIIWLVVLGIGLLGGISIMIKLSIDETSLAEKTIIEKENDFEKTINMPINNLIVESKDNLILDLTKENNQNEITKSVNKNDFPTIPLQKGINRNSQNSNLEKPILTSKKTTPSVLIENKNEVQENENLNIKNEYPEGNQLPQQRSFLSLEKIEALASGLFLEKNIKKYSPFLIDLEYRKKGYKGEPAFKFSIGIQGGVSFANRKLKSNGPEYSTILSFRNQLERQLETIHLDLNTHLIHQSGVELTTGFQMTRIAERFLFEGVTLENDTIDNGLYGYLINPNGDTIPVYGEIVNSTETTFKNKYYNNYRMIGIPILAGYHWGNDSWSIGVQGGIVANLKLKTSGKIFDQQGGIIDIGERQEEVFKSKIGFSYYFGGSYRHSVTKHLQISISPFFRYIPNSFSLSNFPLQQKYNLVGVKVGARYLF